MAKRRSFVPSCPVNALLEERIAPSSIGGWFTSQYNQIKKDLGITHSTKGHNAASGIEQLWKESAATLAHPQPAASTHHAKK